MLSKELKDHLKRATAIGNFIHISSELFIQLLDEIEKQKTTNVLLLYTTSFWRTKHLYLISYKGISFATRTNIRLSIPNNVEILEVDYISKPSRYGNFPSL